ncbi:RHS domain-containing protein [Diaphorobacter aerolatus]|uniref:RHS domain-containing protein n=1 Tax=Diaphorobacter aerolatus TaxID=1288495 RepID=A0A7H0GLC0_9BURK|nr:RHS domain-containing protein [Diaphorobacter aerolatus]QNP49086.1 RHS domain-containing protein [Diaphorobacter aerolatus]
MRLIEERRGSALISYVYEPDSYVPLARLDADGEHADAGGMGTRDDAQPPATTPAHDRVPSKTAANDSLEAQYWEALSAQAHQHWSATGTDGQSASAKLCNVYYFHTDQVGMPQELSNAQGQLIWQASYKTWGATVSEKWEIKALEGQRVHALGQGSFLKMGREAARRRCCEWDEMAKKRLPQLRGWQYVTSQ